MSPILKRDVAETIRQARRLATIAAGGRPDPDGEHDKSYKDADNGRGAGGSWRRPDDLEEHGSYGSGADRRQGIGVENGDVGWIPSVHTEGSVERKNVDEGIARGSVEGRRWEGGWTREQEAGEGETETERMLGEGDVGRVGGMEYEEVDVPVASGRQGQMQDLKNLLFESTPSLLLSLVGLVFTGELLEHLARWRVFRRVDELFILVPMIGNLKGNLEMCLSARLGTSANIGELDHRHTRRALLVANMTLLGLQALLISCLAAVLSFALGLFTVHRLGDIPDTTGLGSGTNSTMTGATPVDPGLAVGEQEWHEGYTRPGWKQLVMVLATGMGAAGLSSAVLGSFMSSLIVLSRWFNIDPDNITPPVAACLGDLLTLFILALLGTALVGAMDTPLPLICVILMSLAAGWFTKRVMRNQWVKKVAKGGWAPLIGAMLISSGTGMALDKGVGKYRGFALLAISMTGLTGAIGGIHANRLSTRLHAALQSPHQSRPTGLSSLHSAITLYIMAFPCQACFMVFVKWAGWIDLSLGWAGWLCFASTTLISLLLAHYLTLFFWSKDLDPDSYTLPLQSAMVDFLGQLILMVAYEVCILQGMDVVVHEAIQPS
ncbi:solute carrier family 41 member 1 [Papiliotrema laurentii]|uniref:Solute carrier family 41 member 1 n=1 Tax=Papiliotrema laurentii TaxID=5418 RepID=A0AAD9CVI3_PAPLA|nr:solute carrier family 41 member 1 [Papiliotrema laurentii]